LSSSRPSLAMSVPAARPRAPAAMAVFVGRLAGRAGAVALAIAALGLEGCGSSQTALAASPAAQAAPPCETVPKTRCINWRFECADCTVDQIAERAAMCDRLLVVIQDTPNASFTCLKDPAPSGVAAPGPVLCVDMVEFDGTNVPVEDQTILSCQQDGSSREVSVLNCSSPTPDFCEENATSTCEETLASPSEMYSMCYSGSGCGTEFYCAGGSCNEGAQKCLGGEGGGGNFLSRARPWAHPRQ